MASSNSFALTPGIEIFESPLGDRVVRQFLLTGNHAYLLIDTGLSTTPDECLAPQFQKMGLRTEDVEYVLISHSDFDHQGGNTAARQLFPNASFVCHRLDKSLIESSERLIQERYGEFLKGHRIADSPEATSWIRDVCGSDTPMDIVLDGEAELRIGCNWSVRILHTPGHSKGHLSVWDERSRTAIIADAALGSYLPQHNGRPAFPPTYRYLDAYRQTIERLRALGAAHLLTSHFPLMSGADVDAFLSESLTFTHRLQQNLESGLAATCAPLSTRELIEKLSPKVGEWPQEAGLYLAYPLIGHLEAMEHEHKVSREYRDGIVHWTLSTDGSQ